MMDRVIAAEIARMCRDLGYRAEVVCRGPSIYGSCFVEVYLRPEGEPFELHDMAAFHRYVRENATHSGEGE